MMARITAWNTSASASSLRPAPTARATDEATPLPRPPFDIMVIIMKTGNTSATPASASVPRKPTYQPSAILTAVCATRTVTVGSASLNSVGRIGAVSSVARVVSLLARAAEVADDGAAVAASISPPADKAAACFSAMIAPLQEGLLNYGHTTLL